MTNLGKSIFLVTVLLLASRVKHNGKLERQSNLHAKLLHWAVEVLQKPCLKQWVFSENNRKTIGTFCQKHIN